MNPIRPWLYIGKYRETLNRSLLDLNHIQAMLQLADRVEQSGIRTLFLPVEDFAPVSIEFLKQGVEFVKAEKRLEHKVLIACGAGINRSSAFATAVLKEEEHLSLLEAFRSVQSRHPEAQPHRPVWEALCDYYQEAVPYAALGFDKFKNGID